MRPRLEVADIFRRHGDAFRAAQGNRLSHHHRRVMRAIETCRTAVLGGHAEQCRDCGAIRVSYNSCRDRHCPKCQGLARLRWINDRDAELLPVPYFHVVFTVPPSVAAIALQNKAIVYDILFKATAETIRIISADPKHLGAQTGMIAVLHTWGQTLTHHPHLHCIIPGGGLSADGRWIGSRPHFFLPVRVLSRLYRRLFLQNLQAAFDANRLNLCGQLLSLRHPVAFFQHLDLLRHVRWVVYAKRPFDNPQHVTRYLGRYTHRVAITNSRLIEANTDSVRFRWKDYRAANKWKMLTLHPSEFIRRFLLHVLPRAFRRIRHYGFLANASRSTKLEQIRAVLNVAPSNSPQTTSAKPSDQPETHHVLSASALDQCPICGGSMQSIPFSQTTLPAPPEPYDTS